MAPESEHPSPPQDERRFVTLTRPECIKLLDATQLGRLVLISPAQTPIIRPVNYRFDTATQSVVFRTGAGSKFHALVQSSRALFEIDSFEPETHTGWSVIISGATEVITHLAEVRRLSDLGLDVWAPGERPHWIRIRARTVTGRAVVPAGQEGLGTEGASREGEASGP